MTQESKTFTEQEVIELLKKFDSKFTHNVNSDKWYKEWIINNQYTPNIKQSNEDLGIKTTRHLEKIEIEEIIKKITT